LSKVSDEIYDRILDLAVKVAEGVVDPFDVDVGRFISLLAEKGELDKLDYDLLVKDIRALNGLIMILESQSRLLRRKGLGLYLDKALMRLRIYKMDIMDLAKVFSFSWSPIVEVEALSDEAIFDALSYFNSLRDLGSRRLKFEEREGVIDYDYKPRIFIIPEALRKRMMVLLDELREVSRTDYIDYNMFIHAGVGDPVERAYILSFLISDGWVDVKINRLEEKIYIRARDERRMVSNPSTLPVVVRREEGQGD
jgi:hypothetical protein